MLENTPAPKLEKNAEKIQRLATSNFFFRIYRSGVLYNIPSEVEDLLYLDLLLLKNLDI